MTIITFCYKNNHIFDYKGLPYTPLGCFIINSAVYFISKI